MSDENKNNKRNFFSTQYSSTQCRNDPENPAQMICTETTRRRGDNGEMIEESRDYIVDQKNNQGFFSFPSLFSFGFSPSHQDSRQDRESFEEDMRQMQEDMRKMGSDLGGATADLGNVFTNLFFGFQDMNDSFREGYNSRYNELNPDNEAYRNGPSFPESNNPTKDYFRQKYNQHPGGNNKNQSFFGFGKDEVRDLGDSRASYQNQGGKPVFGTSNKKYNDNDIYDL